MVLEGVVTNVAAFGAFVDVGVHQDGLVHISAMASTFVKDPRAVVKPGDIVRVKVLDVDKARKRISLTMRLEQEAEFAPGPVRACRWTRPRRRGKAAGARSERFAKRSRRRAAKSRLRRLSRLAQALTAVSLAP